jgi:membrane fusion protein (multidrug efflux system)
MGNRVRLIVGGVVTIVIVIGAWIWLSSGHESTDDAQIEGHVTQVAPRVGGTVLHVAVNDNQQVELGAVLVEIDPRDYQVALDKAKAELADAQATAAAAQSNVPITSATATGNIGTAQGSVEQARGGADAAQKEVDAAHARVTTAQARQREAEANAVKASRDVERLRGLLAKDEVSQQQFDSAVAAADAAKASVDSTRSLVAEAETGIRVAESRLVAARGGEQQAHAALQSAQTGPEQVTAVRARAASAEARVLQARAALQQAELNLQYATVRTPQAGIVSRKSVEAGQVIQAGQPLMAIIPLENVWVTANFKETQLTDMRAGQRATIKVDAYGGKEFKGHVDSIAAATGARFSMLPPENATGNYVKVVQRVPVKIVLEPGQDPEHLLRPGLSVEPTVYMK